MLPTEPFQYGDWLDPDAPGDRPWEAKVSSDYVANAFYVQSRAAARAAPSASSATRTARPTTTRSPTGSRRRPSRTWGDVAVTTQTGAALALEFDLAPAERRESIAAGLAEDVRRENGRIATGFLGTPLVLFALSRNGHLDEAYLMLLRRDAPSWLYQVDRGATTVWERWDAILPGRQHPLRRDGRAAERRGGPRRGQHALVQPLRVRRDDRLGVPHRRRPRPGRRRPGLPDGARRAAAGRGSRPRERVDRDAARTPGDRLARSTGDVFEATLEVPFGARAVLDLPVTDASIITIDGAPASGDLFHGTHRITVTAPAVARPSAVVAA